MAEVEKLRSKVNNTKGTTGCVWQLLWVLLVLLAFFALALFLLWLSIVLLWNTADTGRDQKDIVTVGDKTIVVEYPNMIRADEKSYNLDFTLKSTSPITLELQVPSLLSVDSVGSPSALITSQTSFETQNLTLAWPPGTHDTSSDVAITSTLSQTLTASSHISGAEPLTSVITATTFSSGEEIFPAKKEPLSPNPNTITLVVANSRLNSGNLIGSLFWNRGYQSVLLQSPQIKKGEVSIKVEDVSRAQWRSFAETYPFVVLVPMIISFMVVLGKLYFDERDKTISRAQDLLTEFRDAVNQGKDMGTIEEIYSRLNAKNMQSVFDEADKKRVQSINRIIRGDIPEELSADAFNTWSDVWAGALSLAVADEERVEVLKLNQKFRRLVRQFPRDRLDIPAQRRYRKLFQKIHLLPTAMRGGWPEKLAQPQDFSETAFVDKISDIHIFPVPQSDAESEEYHLFSKAGYYWRRHPLYDDLLNRRARRNIQHSLVWGAHGVGRTAMAMALTRHTDDAYSLCSYHAYAPNLMDVQRELAQTLLLFIKQRAARLMLIEPEDRNLLARVLQGILGRQYVVAQLDLSAKTLAEEGATQSEQDISVDEALLELHLMQRAVEATDQATMDSNTWLLGLEHSARRLKFERIRIALDLDKDEWSAMSQEHLASLLAWARKASEIPIQFLIFVPWQDTPQGPNTHGLSIQELHWRQEKDKDAPLRKMLIWRAEQSGMSKGTFVGSHVPEVDLLVAEAQSNPRRLAQLWQRIVKEYPSQEQITGVMIKSVTRELNRDG